jgi:hypothetical protein
MLDTNKGGRFTLSVAIESSIPFTSDIFPIDDDRIKQRNSWAFRPTCELRI